MNALVKLRNFADRLSCTNFSASAKYPRESRDYLVLISKAYAFLQIVKQIDRQIKFHHDRKHDRRRR